MATSPTDSTNRQGTEEKELSPIERQSPPNGGIRAWLQVFGSFLIIFNIWGLVLCFGAFQSFYQAQLLHEYSPSAISWIGTTEVFLLNVVGFLTGPLFDLGYHDALLFSSSGIVVFAVMMLSLSTKFYQIFLSQGICLGVGSGILNVPSLALVAGSFTTKRPLAVTLVTAGSAIGGIVYTVVLRRLLPVLGFPWTVRVIGFIAVGTSLMAIPMIRARRVERATKPRPMTEFSAFREAPYVLFNIGGFLKFLGLYIPFVDIPVYAETSLHVSTDKALDLLAYANAASFVGRLLAAWAANKIGVMTPWTICAFASGIICLSWLAVSDYVGMVVFSVLYGFFVGALIGLPSAVVPYVAPMAVLGTRMGMTWGIAGTALLIGSPIAGTLIDRNNADFSRLQVFSGVMLLAGASTQVPLWLLIRGKIVAAAAARRNKG